MDHEQTRTEKAKAVLDGDLKKLDDLDQEIRIAERHQKERRLSGEPDLGMVEGGTASEQPDKGDGSV